MKMSKLSHVLSSGTIAAVGLYVAYLSYTQQPADAFLFPRLISTVFVALALWTFGKAVMGLSKTGDGVSAESLRRMLPGLVVSSIYVFWAAKSLGFYTATAIAFFILLSIYDPKPHTEVKSWGKRVIITAGFIAVMYGLFALLLKVYTPREIFF